MKEIQRQIKEKNFKKVYLLTGDEPYLVLQARRLLTQALVREGDTMNYTVYAESRIDLPALKEQADTYPFFSERRLIVLDKTGILKTGKDAFVSLMQEMPETTHMVICEPEVDKRTKVYKWIKKNGYVAEFLKKKQTEKVLLRFVTALLAKEKKKIRESTAHYFLEKVGDDMFQIKNEAEKLIAYAGDATEITRADVDAVSSEEAQDKIFALVDAIALGEKSSALACYNDLILRKEPPLHILFLVIRQYRILSVIGDMRTLRKPDDAIAKTAGIPAFALRKNERQLRSYSKGKLLHCLEQCVQVEEEIKTGQIDAQIGVEMLLVGLAEKNL